MKIVCIDSYCRDYVGDIPICEGISHEYGVRIVDLLNRKDNRDEFEWFVVKNDDYVLKIGRTPK